MERNINSKFYIENVEKGYFVDQPTLPNSIPSIKGFVGREDYLTDLRESYQRGSRSFVLHGIGGVGKSATALQFAGEIAGEYEAKIFVEMRGMSKTPLSARDAMLVIVREFARETPAEISDAQLKSLFVSKVNTQPTLIVLDNAANIEAVESLNQADACLIVTSRQSFRLTGGESKRIAKMLEKDARNLLFENGGGETRFDGRADELAYLAGYLPMALKPLAALLAEDELETAADLTEKYRDKQVLLRERVRDYDDLTVEASFELSYEALTDEMKERWRRLSIFPTDFDEAAIEFVLYISKAEAKTTQKHLRKFNLLDVNPKTNRFSLHDLVKVFTNTKLFEDERLTTQHRHACYYVLVLQKVGDTKSDDIANTVAYSLRLIDAEWKNVIVGQNWSAKMLNEDDSIAEICAGYASAAARLTVMRLTPRERIAWFKPALTVAVKCKNKSEEGFCLGNLGLSLSELEQYEDAAKYLHQALIIAQNTNNLINEAAWMNNLGRICIEQNKRREAAKFLKRSIRIDSDPKSQCISLINLV